MFFSCLFTCILEKNPHKRLKESKLIYSANQPVLIHGKIWLFIRQTSTDKYLFYLYENKSNMFITTFGLFSINEMGDFIKLPFGDGVDKIETTHDHVPKIFGNHLEIKLSNGKHTDVDLVVCNSKQIYLMIYDVNCPISQIK
jgi:hypothetical protein